MSITVVERKFYNDEKVIHIFEEVKSELGTIKKVLIYNHYFMTGWNRDDKVKKFSEKQYEKVINILFNRDLAEIYLNDSDEVLKKFAEIRMKYYNVYFKRETFKEDK